MKKPIKLIFRRFFFSLTMILAARGYGQDFTISEVSKHNKPNDCWLIIESKVYDVTSYIPRHPASPNLIAEMCGRDASDAWKTKGGAGRPHSARANLELERFFKGGLLR